MMITPDNLAAIYINFSTLYERGYSGVTPWHPRLAMDVVSTGASNTYGWIGKVPTMRAWEGDRIFNDLGQHSFNVVNNDYELSIQVDRNKILDDQLGTYGPMLNMMGFAVAKQPDYLLVTAMQDGEGSLCYDGQYYFDTDHPVNKFNASMGTQGNYSSSGKALTRDNFESVRATMRGLLGEDGKPLGVSPNLIVVPPALEAAAELAVKAELIPNTAGTASQSNTSRGKADILVVPELAGEDTTWYMFDTTKGVMPFVNQKRALSSLQQFVNPNDPNVFRHRMFQYGVDMRGAIGYGPWYLAYKAVG